MKHRSLTAAAVVATALLAAPGTAHALRVGVYGTTGAGSAEWQFGADDRDNVSRDTTHAGYGVVFDSGLFSGFPGYRISLGWERIDHSLERGAAAADLEGLVIDQDIVFSLGRHPGPLRFWLGPEFRVGFLSSNDVGFTDGTEDFLSLGVGPVVGLDVALAPGLAVSWKLGVLASGIVGGRADDTAFNETHAFATFAVLFGGWGEWAGWGYDDGAREPRLERRGRRY